MEISKAQSRTHECTVWQKGHHEEYSEAELKEGRLIGLSPRLRQRICGLACHPNQTPTTIQLGKFRRGLLRFRGAGLISLLAAQICSYLKAIQRDYLRAPFDRLPWFRKAKPPKIKSAYDSFKNTNALDANPLMAVQTIYDRWPDAFFLSVQLPRRQQRLQALICKIACPYT